MSEFPTSNEEPIADQGRIFEKEDEDLAAVLESVAAWLSGDQAFRWPRHSRLSVMR